MMMMMMMKMMMHDDFRNIFRRRIETNRDESLCYKKIPSIHITFHSFVRSFALLDSLFSSLFSLCNEISVLSDDDE